MKRPAPDQLDELLSNNSAKTHCENVRGLLCELDTRFRGVQRRATRCLAESSFLRQVGEVANEVLNDEHVFSNSATSVPRNLVNAGITSFESRRIVLEGQNPFCFYWHGPTSQQRMFLQDEQFVSIMQDRQSALLTVALMLSHDNGLGKVLLAALQSRFSLAYMVTASPNWENIPLLANFSWDLPYAFVHHDQQVAEEPVFMTTSLLKLRLRSIENVAYAVCRLTDQCIFPPSPGMDDKELEVAKLLNAPLSQIYERLRAAIAIPGRAAMLVKGPSGSSTELYPMICQILSVMTYYDDVSKLLGSGEGVMSLGMFSHALDAKHLVAGMYALQQWPPPADSTKLLSDEFGLFLSSMTVASGEKNDTWRAKRRRPLGDVVEAMLSGLVALRNLVERCLGASGDPSEAELLSCRLKQTLMLNVFMD